jgi:hypothetical protein
MLFVRTVAATAMVLVSTAAQASNSRGHMMVSAVVWEQLEESTQEPVIELLKLNPDRIRGVAKADQGKTAFMKAATWPDFIRGYREEANSRDRTTTLPTAAIAGPVAEKLADRLVGSFAEELLERD